MWVRRYIIRRETTDYNGQCFTHVDVDIWNGEVHDEWTTTGFEAIELDFVLVPLDGVKNIVLQIEKTGQSNTFSQSYTFRHLHSEVPQTQYTTILEKEKLNKRSISKWSPILIGSCP